MRINKFLTEQGFCSRRKADQLILEKRVKINERVAVLGDQVGELDKVFVDSQQVATKTKVVYIMYNKPLGITCTTDQRVEGNIIDAINYPDRIFTIGRLDKYSTGLILLTNDGDIVNKILRAKYMHEKEYVVEINQTVTDEFVDKMSRGVDIGDCVTLPCKVRKISGNTFSIILTEGKNRQIRRMCEVHDVVVKHLHRIRVMSIRIGNLKPGEWRDIPPVELATLKSQLDHENVDASSSVKK
jgi:23S rRNA pseudouridine2604 synthase